MAGNDGTASIICSLYSRSTKDQKMASHACEIQVTFPTNLQAEQAMKILQVDKEPTNRVHKSFRLVEESEDNGNSAAVSMVV